MPRKVFVANEILTAGAVNTNLMDQAVMVFADAAARTAALGSPSEGMVSYLEDSDSLELYTTSWGPVSPAITPGDLPAGSVLQVVSTTKTNSFSWGTASFVDITGLSVTITPSSASSKIMVFVNASISGDYWHTTAHQTRLQRDSTSIYISDSGPTTLGSGFGGSQAGSEVNTRQQGTSDALTFLDAPSSTAALTYKLQIRNQSTTNAGFINKTISNNLGGASSITVMEVAG